MPTVEELVVQGLARAMEFTDTVPSTRSVLYRRLGVRQQQLYARAAARNPDYAGICAVGALVAGAVDFADLVPPLQAAESITKVEIADAGTSVYPVLTEVNIVPSLDVNAGLAPRVTVRDRVASQVGADLAGVVSLRVFYSRVPLAVAPTDGARAVDLPDPHSELLVLDLALTCLTKLASKSAADAAAVLGPLTLLGAEEKLSLAAWDAHVGAYAAVQARFG